MKRLPNVQHAVISESKIKDYLLSRTHTLGKTKAAFFERFGFTQNTWQALSQALLDHAERSDVIESDETPFGRKFVLEGALATPDGRNPVVRTVWFIEAGETQPRLITAYPAAGGAL